MDLVKKLVGVTGVLLLVCLLLISTPPKAVSFDMGEGRLVYDDGDVRLYAVPKPQGYTDSLDEPEVKATAKLPKARVLSCHVTQSEYEDYTILAWPEPKELRHVAYFEILNASDSVKLTMTITGPQWPTPEVAKLDWYGPIDPDTYWRFEALRTYDQLGFHKITVKVIPKKNKVNGASTATSMFHVTPPVEPPPAP